MKTVTIEEEVERKYEVDVAARVPDLSTVAGAAESHTEEPVTLRAVYFDTAGGALASVGYTLRRREGGSDEGWHLKTPSRLARMEHRVPLSAGAAAVPQELHDLVLARTRRSPLVEIARVTTERTVTTVFAVTDDTADTDTGRLAVAELADDRVSATDTRTGVLRLWREWEVEALDRAAPDHRLLDRIEQTLITAGATASTSPSKLARATGRNELTLRTAASASAPSAPTSATSMSDAPISDAPRRTALGAALGVLSPLRDALLEADPLARSGQPDSVHQMRIVVRRLRSVLVAFRGVLDREVVTELRTRLGWLGDTLGVVRDAEVRHARAESLLSTTLLSTTALSTTALSTATEPRGADAAVHRRLVDDAWAEYESLRDSLLGYLASDEYFVLLDDLDTLIARPPLAPGSLQEAHGLLRATVRRESKRARRMLKRADRDNLAGLHRARKAARRLRYIAEALGAGDEPLLGKKTGRLAASAEAVQDLLGEHRDAILFVARLNEAERQAREAGESVEDYAALIDAEKIHARTAADGVDGAERALRKATKAW